MMKIVLVTLALLGVVLAETTFEKTSLGRAVPVYGPDFEVSRPAAVPSVGVYSIPPDNGGNWGDNLWRARKAGDVLLTREVQINDYSNAEQSFKWNGNFPGKAISHIRMFSVGRQRAYVASITANGGSTASATIQVAPNNQFRLMIEVYGK